MYFDRPLIEMDLDFRYVIDFKNLDILFHEIPKNGSSSIKRFLLAKDQGLDKDKDFPLGHFKWRELFPSAYVSQGQTIPERQWRLLIVRDPVSRLKSAYKNIFCEQMGKDLEFREFFQDFLVNEAFTSGPEHIQYNHFKPQSYFVPRDILSKENLIIFDLTQLSSFKRVLQDKLQIDLDGDILQLNQTKDSAIEVNMSDEEIEQELRKLIPYDFDFYKAAYHIAVMTT